MAPVSIRRVQDDQWQIVAWLWQLFRHDLATVVHGLPYGDGRYSTGPLDRFPSADGAGYLAWRPHPKTGEEAPVAFALVAGLQGAERSMVAFWVAPVVRGEGVGQLLAASVLGAHAGPWSIGFQHENDSAARFWRRVADRVFTEGNWIEVVRSVPDRPDLPPDHFIESPGVPMS